MFIRLYGIPEPPEGYVPSMGSSSETWTNIYKNKGRIDYCMQQFGVQCLVAGRTCKGLESRVVCGRGPGPKGVLRRRG